MVQLSPDADTTPPKLARPVGGRHFRPGLFVNARLFRLLLGLGLVAVAAWYGYLYLFNKVSIAGVVDAPLITLVSQIDGQVAGDMVGQGAAVKAGQPVATIVDDRVDNRTLMSLGRSLDAARSRLPALSENIAKLTAMKADLERRSREYQAALVDRLRHEIAQNEASLAAARIVERQAGEALQRGIPLIAHGNLSQAGYDDLSYAHQRAGAEVTRAEATLARSQWDLSAAKAGMLLGNNWSDVPYSTQRVDEVDIRIAGLRHDESSEVATITELEGEYAAEKERIDRLSQQRLTAPVDGVVWRTFVAPGAQVMHGTPLFEVIDCRHLYVEATTRERFFEALSPGQRVRVRLEGSDKKVAGSIRVIVGPGASLDAASKLSVITHRAGTEAQLIVDINSGALPPAPGSTCNVGRSAKVYFE